MPSVSTRSAVKRASVAKPARATKPARAGKPARAKPAGAAAEKQLASFLAKYTPDIVRLARALRDRLRADIPGGVEFVYDNYNSLVLGYGPTERPSEAVLSLALSPRWVNLCFLRIARLKDPDRILLGSGKVARHAPLASLAEFERPAVQRLLRQAIAEASPAFPDDGGPRLVIQSISAKQRPRRPD
jgi:hypothetical protein